MKLQVTPQAVRWFKDEMDLTDGDAIRFYIQLYGSTSTNNHNFSLGIMRDTPPRDAVLRTEVDGITFFFTDGDRWFLNDYAMTVSVEDDELRYTFLDDEAKA